jgi:uncharacterized protein YjdB
MSSNICVKEREIKMKNITRSFLKIVLLLALLFSSSRDATAETNKNYIKINNETLEFNQVIYVDGTNGNDIIGNGSIGNPYKSIIKAQSVAVDGDAIYIKAGVYEERTWAGIYESKHKLTFIGEPNKTIIVSDGTKHTSRDNHAVVFETDCSAYNLIFRYTVGNRSTNYSRALVGSGDMNKQQYGKFYNCVFVATDKAPAPCYGNKDINVSFYNCSFVIPGNFLNSYIMYGTNKTKWINCAMNKDKFTTDIYSLGNVEFSLDNYSILSEGWKNTGTGLNPDGTTANIGVYGGVFAWNSLENETPTSTIKLTANGEDSKVLLLWNTVDKAEKYIIKRSITAGGPYMVINTVTGSDTAYNDTDVVNKTTYYYVVSAFISENESSDSNEQSVTPTSDTQTVDYMLKVVLEPKEKLQLSIDDTLVENTNMTWTSSDSTVAQVDANGVVTAIKAGNVVIHVQSPDGSYSDDINILVVDNADAYRLAVDLKVGKTSRLAVDDFTNTLNVTWYSSDVTVATVSSKGVVTAKAKGLTLVKATDKDGNVIGQVYVRVRE